jgi:hypothetical protein
MPIKPGARLCNIAEQIIYDPVSDLSVQFVYIDGSTAPYRLRLFGANTGRMREIAFDKEGKEAATGTAVAADRRPSWLRAVK